MGHEQFIKARDEANLDLSDYDPAVSFNKGADWCYEYFKTEIDKLQDAYEMQRKISYETKDKLDELKQAFQQALKQRNEVQKRLRVAVEALKESQKTGYSSYTDKVLKELGE